ncbi:MAG: hypothetical protein ACRDYE_12875 [Acidimicrobiales bacterium]
MTISPGSIDAASRPYKDPFMGKRQKREALASQVDNLQRRLSLTYVVVEELAESLIHDHAAGDRTDDLYCQARRHLEPIASEVEALAKLFWLANSYLKAAPDVALRGTMVSVFMGAQVVALDLTLDAMALVGRAEGLDDDFLRKTIQACTDVYTTHASMVDSALCADFESLTIMRQVYGTDADGTSAAFSQLVDDFKLVKDRMLARA